MAAEPEIRTIAGVLRGEQGRDVAIFRGIPYAAPPVGYHRFGPPVPAQPWEGVREAIEFGPAPPAASTTSSDIADDSGDWLTLNVWSPDLGAARLPVLVWICGGAYLHCHSANPHHDCASLAAAGAVVISVNYRVGVEGFAHIAGAPDNRGLLDQVAALRWVRDNVAAFGGDPDNVTVFGQSAGAGSIAALLVMPAAAGLFRRAVVQSLPGTYFSTGLAADISATIAGELSAQATVGDLSRFSPEALARATGAVLRTLPQRGASWGPVVLTGPPFAPVVDGDVLPAAPWSARGGGAARGVDLLVGHTRDEYRLLAAQFAHDPTDNSATAMRLLPDGNAAYRAAYPDATPAMLHELAASDWLFRMPTLHLADAHAAHLDGRGPNGPGRTWTYELCWGPDPTAPPTASTFCSSWAPSTTTASAA